MKNWMTFLVGALLISSLSACGIGEADETAGRTEGSQVAAGEKPEQITLEVDSTFMADETDRKAIESQFESLTGIKLIIQDIDEYADSIEADVMMISSDYYGAYASQQVFWDMSKAWEQSEVKVSGRIDEAMVDAFYIDEALYGFPISSGNGCVTYIRQDWLNKLGLKVPESYEEYVKVLRAFTNEDPDGNGKDDTYGVTAVGLLTNSEPYVQYLPEFWQDAYPGIYQNQEGVYVDGFTEENMIKALDRLKAAYQEGLIDQEVLTNIASSCREKFYSGKAGVLTYKAGDWYGILEDNTKMLSPEAELVAIPPIKEVGNYIKDLSFALAIPSNAPNPEGVFKYFIEALVDGGAVQELFTYGIEGVDYTKTEAGYQPIQGTGLNLQETNKMLINPLLSISQWQSDQAPKWLADERDMASNELLQSYCKLQPLVKYTDELINASVEISDARQQLIVEVVTGDLSVSDGIAAYRERTDALMEGVLASLNA